MKLHIFIFLLIGLLAGSSLSAQSTLFFLKVKQSMFRKICRVWISIILKVNGVIIAWSVQRTLLFSGRKALGKI